MKKGIHPKNYRLVVFKDIASQKKIFCKSTVETKKVIKIKNKVYPLYKMEVSSFSHPIYIGKLKYINKAGRIEKFNSRYSSYLKKDYANMLRFDRKFIE
ncbi:type B 50S ribosomal protein L31 [Candidatus Karelsulcia muelleri]